ncbi:MAG: NAD(P)/FAD-dependent oxidoreductase [Pseudomonadales bacterium]
MQTLKSCSFWFDQLCETATARPALTEDIDVDVAIIGAGYTGLWTAYYLKKYRPELSVAVLERNVAGFGASGRNGGWLIGGMAGELKQLARLQGEQRKQAKQLLTSIVDEVASVCTELQIDCDLHRGGSIAVAARYPYQKALLRDEFESYRRAGFDDSDFQWLEGAALEAQVNMHRGTAGLFTPHCAAINPAKLVCGLAAGVARSGVTIYENSAVRAVDNGLLTTAQGSVRASVVVPATEGFGERLLNLQRYLLPIQSLLIATQPLTTAQWDQIGLAGRPTFCDSGRLTTYGQRTLDGRIVFGARGGYQFGGRAKSTFSLHEQAFRLRESLLRGLFPIARELEITHGWGGTLGMARGFTPFALFDQRSGLGCAGGYGGEGVGASNLFARTLVDLILGRDSELVQMPWAYDASLGEVLCKWEPEPLRWLTYQAILKTFSWEDNAHSSQACALSRHLSSAMSGQLEKLLH